MQKVFLGIYAAVPALDRFGTKGLRKLKKFKGLPKYINKLKEQGIKYYTQERIKKIANSEVNLRYSGYHK